MRWEEVESMLATAGYDMWTINYARERYEGTDIEWRLEPSDQTRFHFEEVARAHSAGAELERNR